MHLAYLHYLCADDTALNHVRQFAAAATGLRHRIEVHAMNPGRSVSAARHTPGLLGRMRAGFKRKLSRYLHEPKEVLWNARYFIEESRILRSSRPDVLVVRDHLLTASCVPVARRLDLPLVLEFNAPAAESRLYYHEYLHLPLVPEWIEAWKLREASAVTVVSGSLKDYLLSAYDLDADKITVVPNGADLEVFDPKTQPGDKLPPTFHGGVVVGSVGSFQKWHGADLLAHMLRSVGESRAAARFLFVGDGPELRSIRQAAAQRDDKVLFTGRVAHSEVPALVASLDIAVVAEAAFYMSPLKVIEWMAAGRAIVAPRYPALEELIDHEVHGLLFSPGDGNALVEAVLQLVDDAGLREELGRAAAVRARSKFSWTENASRVMDVCREAVSRHKTSVGRVA